MSRRSSIQRPIPLLGGLLAVSLLLFASAASADRTTRFNYKRALGAGLWSVSYSPDGGEDFSMVGVMGKAAYEFSRSFSVEAHIGTTDEDERSTFGGAVPVSLRINVLAGVLAKYSFLVERNVGWGRLYGLAGASFVDVEAEGQGETGNDNDTGLSYGLGFDLFGGDRVAFVLEWVRYLDQSDYTLDAPMAGLLYRF